MGTPMFVRAYLRASTQDQDPPRARADREAFAAERGLQIAATYAENESGAKLARPELFRLLADARPGDMLLVEQVDRLSHLTVSDWERLKSEIAARKLRVVALDLPTSWMMANANSDDFTNRMFEAVNGMMLDVLAAAARKDFEDHRRRQAQGPSTGKGGGPVQGPPRGRETQRGDYGDAPVGLGARGFLFLWNRPGLSSETTGWFWSVAMAGARFAKGVADPAHHSGIDVIRTRFIPAAHGLDQGRLLVGRRPVRSFTSFRRLSLKPSPVRAGRALAPRSRPRPRPGS